MDNKLKNTFFTSTILKDLVGNWHIHKKYIENRFFLQNHLSYMFINCKISRGILTEFQKTDRQILKKTFVMYYSIYGCLL